MKQETPTSTSRSSSRAITFLISESTIKSEKEEAIILFSLYRLKKASIDEIVTYIEKLQESEKSISLEIDNIEKTLTNLETIGTVKIEDGKYYMCETILIRK